MLKVRLIGKHPHVLPYLEQYWYVVGTRAVASLALTCSNCNYEEENRWELWMNEELLTVKSPYEAEALVVAIFGAITERTQMSYTEAKRSLPWQ